MNRLIPGNTPEVESCAREAHVRSAAANVFALLAGASPNPLALEDWLVEIAKALGARLATLVALLDDEPIVQHFYPAESGLRETVNWPWESNRQNRRASPAEAVLSVDRRSSFLKATVQHEGLLWVLCVEDQHDRTWSLDEQAALSLAAACLFQFASIQESSKSWAKWCQRVHTQRRLEDIAVVVRRLVHDFNNVLTSVLGFTELSLAQLPPGSAQRNFIGEVYTAAQQGGQLIQQLSLFSTRKTIPQGLKTALRLVVDEEEKRLQKVWSQGVVLKVLVPSGLADVAMDVDSLRLLLGKLLDNAHEAIHGAGTVTLSARPLRLTRADCLGLLGKTCPGSYLEIAVADSGRGLSADGHKRIFVEPFYSTKPGHRGLGLAAVYGILHNYGGGIRLEDGAETGTVARVYLPTLRRPDEATDGNRTGADGVLSSLQLCLATEGETRGKSSNG